MPGWLADVVADQTIASTWGNQIRDQSITVFANAAARDAAIIGAARKTGMVVYLTAEDSFTYWTGTVWKQYAGHGEVAAVSSTTNSGGFAATPGGIIAPFSLTVTAPANRVLEVRWTGIIAATAGGFLGFKRGATQISQTNITGNVQENPLVYARDTGTAGARTYDLWGWVSSGTASVVAAATWPAVMTVHDMGST